MATNVYSSISNEIKMAWNFICLDMCHWDVFTLAELTDADHITVTYVCVCVASTEQR